MGEHNAKKRVVVVDDHPLLRQALVDLISAQSGLVVCGQAEDRQEGLAAITTSHADIAIVGSVLKNSSGLDLVKDLCRRHPQTRILVMSMQGESLYAERVVRAGASGYLSMRASPDRVVDAVRRVLGGEVYFDTKVANEIASRAVLPGRPGKRSPFELLSDRELEILELIGAGLKITEIAASLQLSTRTIETYRCRIKSKMNLRNATELLRTAVRWNLLRDSPCQASIRPMT